MIGIRLLLLYLEISNGRTDSLEAFFTVTAAAAPRRSFYLFLAVALTGGFLLHSSALMTTAILTILYLQQVVKVSIYVNNVYKFEFSSCYSLNRNNDRLNRIERTFLSKVLLQKQQLFFKSIKISNICRSFVIYKVELRLYKIGRIVLLLYRFEADVC